MDESHQASRLLLSQGESFFNDGNLDIAERCFLKSVELDPTCAEAYNNLGVLYWQREIPGKSLEYFRRALSIDPGNEDAINNLRDISAIVNMDNGSKSEEVRSEELADNSSQELIEQQNYIIKTEKERDSFNSDSLPTEERYLEKDNFQLSTTKIKKTIQKTGNKKQPERKKEKKRDNEKRRPSGNLNRHFLKAQALFHSGDHTGAEKLLIEIVDIAPDHSESLNILGGIGFLAGEYSKGLSYMERAIKINPQSSVFHNTIGNILLALKQNESALDAFKKAVQLNPDYPEGHYNLGLAFLELGNSEEALKEFQAAISLKNDFTNAYTNKGIILMSRNRLEEAIECFRNAIKITPGDMASSVNLSLALQATGEKNDAKKILETALTYHPSDSQILFNLGNILHKELKTASAADCFLRALERDRNNPQILYHLATSLMESGHKKEALGYFENIQKISYGDPKVLNNIGLIHYTLGNYEKALDHFIMASQHKSEDLFKIHNNIGLTYKTMEMWEKAIEHFKKSVEINPSCAEGFHNLAEIQRESGDLEAAAENCRRAITLQPEQHQANTHYSYLLKWMCEWDEFDKITMKIDPLIKKALDNGEIVNEAPFINIIRVDDPEYNRKVADSYAIKTDEMVRNFKMDFNFDNRFEEILIKQNEITFPPGSTGKRKVTIGYISANFRYHPMAHLLANMFRHHDREKFNINSYSLGPDDGSVYRQRFIEDSDLFRDIRNLSISEAVRQIYEDRVDILVDLMGWTQGNRMEIAALRPAPIQIRYMGLAGTTGGNFFDYIITDEIVTPADQEKNYSEKFIWMPHTYQINDQSKVISNELMTREMFNLPEDSFVFCSFNQAYKIDPVIFKVWMAILHKVERSVLWLMPGNRTAKKNLLDKAQFHGIERNRLVFAESLPLDRHLARLRLADIALDTRTIGGAATTSDALWAGLPVITLLGNRFASRMSASILSAIGLPELISYSIDEYLNLAVNLATEKSELNSIKRKLNTNIHAAPLFNTNQFTKDLERAYIKVIRNYIEGKTAEIIDLKK